MRRETDRRLHERYEREKEKLRRLGLPPAEYEQRLREIVKRLGI